MDVLGIDPGLRSTGFALVREGKVEYTHTFVCPGSGKQPVEEFLRHILEHAKFVLNEYQPDVVAVEQAMWYKAVAKVTLPLAHVVGALCGLAYARGARVYLLPARMKESAPKTRRLKAWSDHEYDAVLLARLLYSNLDVVSNVDTLSAQQRKRITIITRRALGKL
jgi:hypothetical protein